MRPRTSPRGVICLAASLVPLLQEFGDGRNELSYAIISESFRQANLQEAAKENERFALHAACVLESPSDSTLFLTAAHVCNLPRSYYFQK